MRPVQFQAVPGRAGECGESEVAVSILATIHRCRKGAWRQAQQGSNKGLLNVQCHDSVLGDGRQGTLASSNGSGERVFFTGCDVVAITTRTMLNIVLQAVVPR